MSLAQAGRWGGQLLTPGEEADDGDDVDEEDDDGDGDGEDDEDDGDEDVEDGLQHLMQGESLESEDRIFHRGGALKWRTQL